MILLVSILKSIECYCSFSSIMQRYAKPMASLCALILYGLRTLPSAVAGGILVGRFGPTWESFTKLSMTADGLKLPNH